MTKYAHLDASTPPTVIGFYDTDLHDYALPPAAELVVVSDADWQRRVMHGSWQWVDGTLSAPPVSLATQALAALRAATAAGVAVTSTSNPGLNTTFALDATTLTQIGSVARDVSAGLGLPGEADTFTYPDSAGTPRAFTPLQVIALYKAMRNRMLVLNAQAAMIKLGGIPTWPDATPIALD
jgi:hypothetical protein